MVEFALVVPLVILVLVAFLEKPSIFHIMLIIGLVPIAIPSVPYKRENALYLLVVFPVLAFFLLTGGRFGLEPVETPLWGGLLVTLVVAIVGIVVSFPLGILLALGRRSQMPIVKMTQIERAQLLHTLALTAIKQGDVTIGKGLLQEAVETHPQHFEDAARALAALDSTVVN